MNKISLYIFLILIFLGLSKGFAPSEQKTHYLINDKVISHFFQGSPLSVLLLDSFQAGLFIKTYYLRLKIIRPFQKPETLVVRTSKDYWRKAQEFQGMSIFRRQDAQEQESISPSIPGALYIGDPGFGKWSYHNSGQKFWKFHKTYRSFPKLLFWGDYRPSFKDYQNILLYQQNAQAFYGPNKEFGKDGRITKKLIRPMINQLEKKETNLLEHFKKLVSLPSRSERK